MQYFLDIVSPYSEYTGEGWYDYGETATVYINPSVNQGEGERIQFSGWTGVGSSSYTGPDNEFQITMRGPVTETAEWQVEYFLDIISEWGTPRGEGWYSKGDVAAIRVDSVFTISDNHRYRFTGWSHTGDGGYTGEALEADVVMSGPVEETAFWKE